MPLYGFITLISPSCWLRHMACHMPVTGLVTLTPGTVILLYYKALLDRESALNDEIQNITKTLTQFNSFATKRGDCFRRNAACQVRCYCAKKNSIFSGSFFEYCQTCWNCWKIHFKNWRKCNANRVSRIIMMFGKHVNEKCLWKLHCMQLYNYCHYIVENTWISKRCIKTIYFILKVNI